MKNIFEIECHVGDKTVTANALTGYISDPCLQNSFKASIYSFVETKEICIYVQFATPA